MSANLFLVRHAHREKPHPDRDNGLSEKGWEQVTRIRDYFQKTARLEGEVHLLSSPKKRCRQTVEKLLGTETPKLEIVDALDEQGPRETLAALEKRVRIFARWWKQEQPDTVILCSHGDWLPLVIQAILGISIDLKKGGVVWIRRKGRAIELLEVRQWL